MNMVKITRFPQPDDVSAEGFNALATHIACCCGDTRTIMVTSRYAGEGKSYVTMNLMRTFAGMGRRVIAVEADLRAAGIQTDYRLRYPSGEGQGLTEYLAGHCGLEQAMYRTTIPNAWMIPAGHRAPNPLQLLNTAKMENLMARLAGEFDVVLLDTPPVCVLADAVALARLCDGALLVVGYRQGSKREIGVAADSIRQAGCRVLGAVLNEVRFGSLSNRLFYYSSRRYDEYRRHGRGRNTRDTKA